jgi:predicted nucleotidyltransferase
MDVLVRARTAKRLVVASEAASRLLDALAQAGFDAVVIGSLATGRFRSHSDIDILIRGEVDPPGRAFVERTVADAMRGLRIPYDLIFACDLTRRQRDELEHNRLDTSAFAKLGPKLERAQRELDRLDEFLRLYDAVSPEPGSEWGRTTAIASAVHNAYNGVEDVLFNLANDVDDCVPKGDTSHQDLLDQMHVGIAGKRPAVLDDALYTVLTELKRFRHLVRHRYGFDFDPARIDTNLARMREALPSFVTAVRALERHVTTADEHERA